MVVNMVLLVDGLINYDSSLFFEPKISINTGENAILEPIIVNGSISFVVVRRWWK